MAKIEPLTDATVFLDVLAKSELLPEEAVAKLHSAASPATDASTLARQLIKDGTLTRWQASQLLRQYSGLAIGPYRLLDQLGKGPTGRVYLAEHGKLGKKVSLKVLPGRFSAQPEVLKRFLDDANRAGALNHRNLIHIFDVGSDGEKYYLSVEYVEGKDFQRLVEASGPLGSAQAIELMRQAAEGVAHAHDQGLMHGDLKPSSLLVDAAGVVKILDLGLSGLADTPLASEGGEESTESPTLASLAFRAPELLSSNQRSDVRSDLYSLGAVLFFLLTGKPPARNAAEVASALDKAPGIPPELANLCDHLLAVNPAERPESAAQVAAALELAGRAMGAGEKGADRPANERPSSAGKPKKSLVAKPLEDAKSVGMTVRAVEKSEPEDGDPMSGFAIKTGRKRKSHAPAIAVAAAPSADAGTVPVVPRSGSRLPLILAAAIGGGVLAIAAMVTIVVLILNRGGSTEVASVPEGKSAAQAKPVSDTGAETTGEANPEAHPEANPEANPPSESADTKGPAAPEADAKAAMPPAAENSPPMPMPAATTPSAATAEPAKTEAKPEPAKTEPAKTKAKPEPAKTAPPPKPAPPAVNPFQGFATTVALPPLEAMGKPAADALTPATLGPVKIEPRALCLIKLKGGETAFRAGTKFLLESAQQGTAERDWEFKLQEGSETPLVIATMSLKKDQLAFQWSEEAAKHQAAPYLCNCVLTLAAGAGSHQVALRVPVTVEPIAAEVDQGAINEKVVVEYAPPGKQIVVEFGPLEGGPAKYKMDPKQELSAFKDFTYLWAGNADDALYLGFKIDVSMSAKSLQITALPQYFVPGAMPRPNRYIKTTARELGNDVANRLKAAEFAALVASKNPKADQKKQQELQAKGAREIAEKLAAQLEQLKETAKALDEGAKLHFRASYLAEDVKVELVSTGGPPPAAAAAPAAKPADAKKK
ncbi:MAG TPA: serine/threonine-protein kinase [Pirellulaceae bacterium]|nr:serine/threonine-protein kinase [Pirellulaceae bacterium]